ncbi:MAG: alpha/beta fold hydrolase [Lautropia sp.]
MAELAEDLPPVCRVRAGHGEVCWREAGPRDGIPLVLLHGIGSGAGSWRAQFRTLARHFRVLAWDAPGYGDSTPLAESAPLAADYAQALSDTLAGLDAKPAIVVGHSLGALMAAAFAHAEPAALRVLILASPVRGYGRAEPAVRARVSKDRIQRLEELGIDGLAASRCARLVSPQAPAEVVDHLRRTMMRATAGGYRQAVHLLLHDDLPSVLGAGSRPRAVLCGTLDQVTPPAACRALAAELGSRYVELEGLAHASYVEAPERFDAAVLELLADQTGC